MSDVVPNRADFLDHLTPNTRVTAQDAMIDRMQVSIGQWAYFGAERNVRHALLDLRQATVATAHGMEVPLFRSRAVNNLYQDVLIPFASSGLGGSNSAATPLIAGRLEKVSYRDARSTRESGEAVRVVANAT